MKKLDVSQILKDYEGPELFDGGVEKLTLRNCLSSICRGFPPTGLTLGEQADCYEIGLKLGSKETKNLLLDDGQHRTLQKAVDAEQPQRFPDGRINPLGQIMYAGQIRKLVAAAEAVEDFSATSAEPVNRIKKVKAEGNSELAAK